MRSPLSVIPQNSRSLRVVVLLCAAILLAPTPVVRGEEQPSQPAKASAGSKARSASTRKPSSQRGTGQSVSRAVEATTTNTPETLPAAIERQIAQVVGASRWGIQVVNPETGQVLYERNENGMFVPASNRKLFTGALALDQLGPDFQFRTYLYHTGQISGTGTSGTLRGNLVILAQGDPTFSNRVAPGASPDWIFRDWVSKVRAAGIAFVDGELLVDCSDWDLGDMTPRGWSASMKQDYYAPQTSPLTLNENLVEIRVKPGPAGKPGIVEFVPPAAGYQVINSTTTGGGKGGISVRRNPDGRVEVTGNATEKSAKQTYSIPCDNPTLYAAAVFRHLLNEAGIKISGSVRIISRKGAVPPPSTDNIIAVYISPKMSEIVKTMMKHSNNHYAEQLFVSVSAIRNKTGGYRHSRQIENEFLRRAGISPQEVRFEDGCGLSRFNQVSPKHFCALLNFMLRHPASQAFLDSLPVAGRDGTLRGRMQNGQAAHRVLAKTGYINNVSCLSGYVVVQPQRTLVFSFLVNEIRTSTDMVKGTEDRLCELLSMLTY
jgi:serine-type D-Ala-D-Ala carboxypeptidase/endopeptidase (penicillin-binding protein 4)